MTCQYKVHILHIDKPESSFQCYTKAKTEDKKGSGSGVDIWLCVEDCGASPECRG